MLVGGGILVLFNLIIGLHIPNAPTIPALGALLYLAIFGGIIVYSAYMYLLSKVPSTLATSYAYINPIVAIGLGIGFGGEQISPIGIGALIIILVGASFILLQGEPAR
jgi:drug/metabolite transporter (DMT)-like permease